MTHEKGNLPGDTGAKHLLSFDVEEYFQVEAASAGVPRDRWGGYALTGGTS
ncbi:MAG TPA: hypothetical protein VM537_10075 [Anaerolineae bacterium]|nr:hypothetical protein [Anaerolineae bacterium]